MPYAGATDFTQYERWEPDHSFSSDDTAEIERLIAAAQMHVDNYTYRTFEYLNSTDTPATTFDSANFTTDLTSSDVKKFHTYEDVDGSCLILQQDLSFVSLVVNGDGVTVSDTEYVTRSYNPKGAPIHELVLLGSANKEWDVSTDNDPEDAIKVVGAWSYSTSPDATIVQQTIRLASWMKKQRSTGADNDRPVITPSGLTIMPGSLPADVVGALAPYRLVEDAFI